MTKRDLARLIIKSYDFKQQSQFDRTIQFLKTVLYHTDNKDIQNIIWYLEDKKRLIKN
jgi:hypothetical protein